MHFNKLTRTKQNIKEHEPEPVPSTSLPILRKYFPNLS